MRIISLCTWQRIAGDILHVQEIWAADTGGQHRDMFSVLAEGGFDIWTLKGLRGSGLMDSDFRMDGDMAHK